MGGRRDRRERASAVGGGKKPPIPSPPPPPASFLPPPLSSYVARGYEKLCKASGLPDAASPHPDVVFLKHNLLDDEDGRTDLAAREDIRVVPTFALYRGGRRVKTLSTRDRAAVAAAINEASGFEWLH